MNECICFETPEHTWTRYGSAVEPGSQMEWNPECPLHPPAPACILCWATGRGNVAAVMFDGIAWYCDEHGDEVITDRLRPRWFRRLRRLLGLT